MATVTKTVGSSGADYATWQAAEDSIGANPTDDYVLKAIIAETLTTTGTTLAITFANSSSVPVVVHGDDVLVAGLPGHTIQSSASAGGACTYAAIAGGVVTYRNLRIKRTDGNTSSSVIGTTAVRNQFICDRCEICSDGADGYLSYVGVSGNANSTHKYYRCRFWVKNGGVGTVSMVQNTGTGCALTMYNCTLLLVDGTRIYMVGSSGSGHSAVVKNTVALNLGTLTACYNGLTTESKNGASDTTASDYDSIVPGDYLANTSTPDLHCISRAVNDDYAGDDLSAAIGHSLDCDNQTVALGGDGWFMGADYVYPAAPTVDATPAPDASYLVGASYSVDHAATGTGTLTFSLTGGALPSGTSLTGATGVVAGTLTTAEAVSYQLTVTDAWSQTGNRTFTSTITEPDIIVRRAAILDGMPLELEL